MTAYTLTPSAITKHEMALRIDLLNPDGTESRGAILARALRGRYAREDRLFYFTLARARKWEALYMADFSAKSADCREGWRFLHAAGPKSGMQMKDAMVVARAVNAARPKAQPLIVEFA